MRTTKVKYCKPIGIKHTLDLEVDHSDHNFYAEGLVTSNSHALSYATLATWTLYLKWNYPKEFFLALLKMSLQEPKPHEEISKISKELPIFGIELLPPDLFKSQIDFSIEGNNIRFGLSAIKGLASKSSDSIFSLRNGCENKFELFQAAKQSKINIGVLCALIQAGAMDSAIDLTKHSRAYTVLEAQVFNLLTDREKKYALDLGEEYNYDLFKFIKDCVANNKKDEKGKTPIFKPTRWKQMEKGTPLSEGGTIQKKSEDYFEIYKRNKENFKLANWFFEKELLGFAYSHTLYDILKPNHPNLVKLNQFENISERDRTMVCGSVFDVNTNKSKSGKNMMRFTLEDNDYSIKCIFFDKSYLKWKKNKETAGQKTELEDKNLVLVSGNRSNDAFFVSDMAILDEKAYLKLKDLK